MMSAAIKKNLCNVISNALSDINEIIGYEYFEALDEISKKFLRMLPLIETIEGSERCDHSSSRERIIYPRNSR